MAGLIEQYIDCPYCGESISVLIDESEGEHDYIEDCQVCCRPINFELKMDLEGHLNLHVYDENE